MRRHVILLGLSLLLPSCQTEPPDSADPALRLHHEAVVLDGHSDSPWWILDGGFDFGRRHEAGHMDVPRLLEGGMDGQFFSIWVDPEAVSPERYIQRALDLIDAVRRTVEANSDRMGLATTAADVRRLAGEGKVAALMGLEGGHAIMDDLAVLRIYHDLGVRYMTLTWNNTNNWADANADTARWGGLNDFGREVVREMNRMGMIVDLSHVSDETFWDVVEVTTEPPITSHSSVRALADHRRNMGDEMIRALAEKGGVICINFFPAFLSDDYRARMASVREELEGELQALEREYADRPTRMELEKYRFLQEAYAERLPPLPLDVLLDHIDHAVEVAGVDHVGLGSDFDGVTALPAGIEDVSKLPNLTRGLLERGYTEDEVKKILGGNLLRVLGEVTGS